jgi:hypothetical protein
MGSKTKVEKVFTNSGDTEYQKEVRPHFKSHYFIHAANECRRIPCDTNITFVCVD